jgi:hypothetical protein
VQILLQVGWKICYFRHRFYEIQGSFEYNNKGKILVGEEPTSFEVQLCHNVPKEKIVQYDLWSGGVVFNQIQKFPIASPGLKFKWSCCGNRLLHQLRDHGYTVNHIELW